MAISSISVSIPQTQTAHVHGRHGAHSSSTSSSTSASNGLSTSQSKSTESLEQLAQEGDPVAIAELKQLQASQTPDSAKAGQENLAAQTQRGATEPGKGDQIDQYA